MKDFDCLCSEKSYVDKSVTRPITCIMMGYFLTKKYKIFWISTNNVFFSWDVKFVENVFPFKLSPKNDCIMNIDDNIEFLQPIEPYEKTNISYETMKY